jgi:hypothetical protein
VERCRCGFGRESGLSRGQVGSVVALPEFDFHGFAMIAAWTLKCALILTWLAAWLDASKPHPRTALGASRPLNKKRYWLECM